MTINTAGTNHTLNFFANMDLPEPVSNAISLMDDGGIVLTALLETNSSTYLTILIDDTEDSMEYLTVRLSAEDLINREARVPAYPHSMFRHASYGEVFRTHLTWDENNKNIFTTALTDPTKLKNSELPVERAGIIL